jgi:hypothetical protein
MAVQAQSGSGEAEGKVLAAQAVKDTQAGRYAEAIQGFQNAYGLNPNPSYLFNLASICVDGLKDPARAHPWAVRNLDAARDAKERGEAQGLLRQIDGLLSKTHGKVEVLVNPAGADLYLDRMDPDARLARTAWVLPGTHTIIAEAPAHDPGQAQVTVKRGARVDVTLILKPQQPLLRVESRTRDVVLYLDGMRVGAPPIDVRMKPGAHVVRAEADGHQTLEQKVDLKLGQVLVVRADLAEVVTASNLVAEPVIVAPPMNLSMSPRRIGAWTAIGLGAALAVAGAATYGVGYGDYKDISGLDWDSQWGQVQSKYDSALTKRNAAIGLWAAGGAALVTGVVLYFLPESSKAAIVPSGPGGPGLTAVARW